MSNGQLEKIDAFEEFNTSPGDVSGSAYLGMADFMASLYQGGYILPPWWSTARDTELRRFWKQSDQLASAVYTMTSKIVAIPRTVHARNKNNAVSVRRIEKLWDNLQRYSQNMEGLNEALRLFMLDYYTQDNGAFMVILAAGDLDKPVEGLPLAIKHLDSRRCTRTGDITFPVVYRPAKGNLKNKAVPLHRTRVFSMSSMASPESTMNGVGYCAISRAVNAAQTLIDLYRYKQEKMGSLPMRQILFGSGISTKALNAHIATAAELAQRGSNRVYSKTLAFGDENPDSKLEMIDMVGTPDFFDEKTSVTLAMYTLSFAFGVDARTFFPASETGATKADAAIQHLKSMGQGIADTLEQIEKKFELYVLPDDAVMEHDYVDDEQDRNQAEIRGMRADNRDIDLRNEVITLRVAREKMLDAGDLSPEEFEELELSDGRLPDGTSTTLLFYSIDPAYSQITSNPFDDPLDTDDAQAVVDWVAATRRIIRHDLVNATLYAQKRNAQHMLAALQALEELYDEGEDMQEEIDHGQESVPPVPASVLPASTLEQRDWYEKTITQFRRGLRASMLGLYRGDFTRRQFYADARGVLARRLREAFVKGLAECGIKEDELTADEKQKALDLITSERDYLPGLADAIINARDNGGKLSTLDYRLDMWVNRYNEIFAIGQTMGCKDKKLKWIRTKVDSCPDCKMLEGKVYRGSTWDEMDIRPQSSRLACSGRNCGCHFDETDEPVTRGRRPRLSKESHHHAY